MPDVYLEHRTGGQEQIIKVLKFDSRLHKFVLPEFIW